MTWLADKPLVTKKGGGRTLRSLIIDGADNYGAGLIAIRMFELFLAGVLRSSTKGVNVDGYATTFISGSFVPANAFDTNNDKLGFWTNEAWAGAVPNNTNQRLIGVYSDIVNFDDLVFNNGFSFNDGFESNTAAGVQNTKIYTSQVVYTDTTYGLITGLDKIFDGVLPKHADENIAQNYSIPLIPIP